MKKLVLVFVLVSIALLGFANPFATQSGNESFQLMEEAVDTVVAGMNGMQSTITGAITGVLPMLIGIFVVFLVIRFVPRLVKSFTKG